jgi:hypothetical protein
LARQVPQPQQFPHVAARPVVVVSESCVPAIA